MKTVEEAAQRAGLTVLEGGAALNREISGVYCCDLLSLAMVRAPEGCAWVTVMAHINAVAVALLRGAGCIVLAEGVEAGPALRQKAREQGIPLLFSGRPVYETASAIEKALGQGE